MRELHDADDFAKKIALDAQTSQNKVSFILGEQTRLVMNHHISHAEQTKQNVDRPRVLKNAYTAAACKVTACVDADNDKEYIRGLRKEFGTPTTLVIMKNNEVVNTRYLSSSLKDHRVENNGLDKAISSKDDVEKIPLRPYKEGYIFSAGSIQEPVVICETPVKKEDEHQDVDSIVERVKMRAFKKSKAMKTICDVDRSVNETIKDSPYATKVFKFLSDDTNKGLANDVVEHGQKVNPEANSQDHYESMKEFL